MAIERIFRLIVQIVIVESVFFTTVSPHGWLKEPPSRSSMWRMGFNTPKNYDDNGLNCGGRQHQVDLGGRCGICGDPYDGVRRNEAGGTYALGVIGRTYRTGEIIPIVVNMTATHGGWFQFKLCVNNNTKKVITQSCLDEHLLYRNDDPTETRYTNVPTGGFKNPQIIEMLYKLPDGVSCSQCVLQWKYITGNHAGYAPEEFYGCSDIAISGPPMASNPISHVTTVGINGTASTTKGKTATTTTATASVVADKTDSEALVPLTTVESLKPALGSTETTSFYLTLKTSSTATTARNTGMEFTTYPTPNSSDTISFEILYKRCKAKGVLADVFSKTCKKLCVLPKSCLITFCNSSCLQLQNYLK